MEQRYMPVNRGLEIPQRPTIAADSASIVAFSFFGEGKYLTVFMKRSA